MPTVTIADDVDLYCQNLGSGHPVVLLHGGCMSHRVWESQTHTLLNAGFRVVTPDLRGHGASDKPVSPYTAEMYADDIAVLLDTLDIDRCTLVGWSLGATIAATFADRHADRLDSLLLVSSSIFDSIASRSDLDSERRLPLEKMIDNQRHHRPRGMRRFVSGMFGTEPDEPAVEWLWSIGMQTPMRVAIKTLKIYEKPATGRLHEALAGLTVPGGIFHGGLDSSATLSDAEFIATDVFADGTFVPFQESGHVPFLEESAKFDDALIEFLRG